MSQAAFNVSPRLQKLFLVAVLVTWGLPLVATFGYGYGSGLEFWKVVLFRFVPFIAPLLYFLLAFWLVPRPQVSKLNRAFYAALIAFLTYSLVALVNQLIQIGIIRTIYREHYTTNFWTDYGSFFGPQVLGALILLVVVLQQKRRRA